MNPDKFTLPLYGLLVDTYDAKEHKFLFITDDAKIRNIEGVTYIMKSPHRKYIFSNTKKIVSLMRGASKIVSHGIHIFYYFYIFPKYLKKFYWSIYGGSDVGTKEQRLNPSNLIKIKYRYLKKIHCHITHIEEESIEVNRLVGGCSKMIYSPMYLSNVSSFKTNIQRTLNDNVKTILVGNSADPSNNHLEIFEQLKKVNNLDFKVFCPLSYGKNSKYINLVINEGRASFSENFIPVTKFMSLDDYRNFLDTMDIAIFNHNRQQAMGTTISLLKLKKYIYMKTNTSSYISLKKRGFILFDVNKLQNLSKDIKTNIDSNINKIDKYYSLAALVKSWHDIYND